MQRKTIITVMVCAKPASSEPIKKITIPISRTGLRPKMSARRPKTIVVAVWASRKAEKTQL
jgi:hypothetical protein